jgi:hypothetical protein
MKTAWIKNILLILIVEKFIQHIVVSFAFYCDWTSIRSTVVVSPDLLIALGIILVFLFALSFWGMLTQQNWAINLVIGLAWFDIIGEFVAQGKIMIAIPISFIVAWILLIFAISYRNRIRKLQVQT